jgi:hypothetical protein
MKPHRQGDVLLLPVKKHVEGGKVATHRELTLALGEETGHHHTLYPTVPGAVIVERILDGQRYVELEEAWNLRHQTHGPHVITPGRYRVIIERERDPFLDALRRVVD